MGTNKFKNLKIGDVIEYNGVKLKAVEDNRGRMPCTGCYFSDKACSFIPCIDEDYILEEIKDEHK